MALTTGLAVIANTLTRPVNSDDLAWQRLLDIWGGQGHAQAWISEDLFPTRYPLYLLLDALGISGRRGVNVAAVVLDVAAGAAFLCGLVLSRRAGPAAAVAASCPRSRSSRSWAAVTWDQVFFSPNTRTLEFGPGRARCSRSSGAPPQRVGGPRRELVAVTVFATAIWISDPFVLYVVGGPAAFVAVHRRRRARATPARHRRCSRCSWSRASPRGSFRFVLELFDVTLRPVAGGARHVTALGDLAERTRAVFDRFVALLGDERHRPHVGPDRRDRHRRGCASGSSRSVSRERSSRLRRWRDASLLARTLVVCVVSTPDRGGARERLRVPRRRHRPVPRCRPRRDRRARRSSRSIGSRARLGRVASVVMAVLVLGAFAVERRHLVRGPRRDAGRRRRSRSRTPSTASSGTASTASTGLAVRSRPDRARRAALDPRRVPRAASHSRLMPWHNDTAVLRGHPTTIAVALDDLGCTLADLERTYGPAARTTDARRARASPSGRPPTPPPRP